MRSATEVLIPVVLAMLLPGGVCASFAASGRVELQVTNSSVLVKVDGDKDDDWWIETSTNLTTWTTVTNVGTLLSGNVTNAPWRSLGAESANPIYYRARQTLGLYDTNLLRTITLSYTQATLTAFTQALASARISGVNVYCPQLTLDNGATNVSIGARFKGNTSYTLGGNKKSVNLELDYIVTNADVMGFSTLNLNNAAGDETIMREPIYFTLMAQYCCSPKACLARLYFNNSFSNSYRGVYSLAQQEDGDLIRAYFPSNNGDRWRTPNPPTPSGIYAFGYRGNTNISTYSSGMTYDLRSTKAASTNVAWARLINAIYVLNNTPTNQVRDVVEDVFAVDAWLWFLAIENLFVDDDSYFNKGADYSFYYEVESGRIHPVEHDGNESFAAVGSLNTTMSPIQGFNNTNRPLLYVFLNNNELRQRYLAHMRTAVDEYFNPGYMTGLINHFHSQSIAAIIADPLKNYTMNAYTNDLTALKIYVTNRYNYMKTNAFMSPQQPNIVAVAGPATTVYATNVPTIQATVTSNASSGVSSVWLYFRDKPYGRFTVRQMFDDGAHEDGAAGDEVYGAATTNYPAGNKIHYYIEARADNAAQAARFSPERAERVTHSYRVALTSAAATDVVINEFMASNSNTVADPQGEYDDWIELRNLTDVPVDLTGLYLTDEPLNPRKWPFPAGTTIPADGYLLVWADENGLATPGLHASFRLAAAGEQILLVDRDANNNQVLDMITFGPQTTDISYGRTAADPDVWGFMTPTPDSANQ